MAYRPVMTQNYSTYFCDVRFWRAETPALATGMGAETDWPILAGSGLAACGLLCGKADAESGNPQERAGEE
jgi:hypothetical protein